MTAEVVATVAAGLAAGALSGLFGVGGGILFVPALVLIADLSQVDAAATSLAAMVPVVVVGAWRQHLYGNVRWRAAVAIGVASIGGAVAGAAIAEGLAEDTLRKLFAVLLLVAALRLAWSARGSAEAD